MSAFEWNKIIASVLTALIIAMVAGILSDEIIRPRPLEKLAYVPPGANSGASVPTETAAKPKPLPPIGPFMAKASAAKGEQIAKVCEQCHTFQKGGPNKIGPNLFGVVATENIASVPNYTFSAALSKDKSEKWTPALLNEWLDNPQHFAPGTKMTFPGLKREQDRADVITYLESLK